MKPPLKGVLHGKTIVLEQDPGFSDGEEVTVEIQPVRTTQPMAEPPTPWWLARFEVNPTVRLGKFVVKGTGLLADDLAARLQEGWDEARLLRTYPELTPDDVAAIREYAEVPLEMRRSFGAWAEDAAELDEYLEWNRRQRQVSRGRLDD